LTTNSSTHASLTATSLREGEASADGTGEPKAAVESAESEDDDDDDDDEVDEGPAPWLELDPLAVSLATAILSLPQLVHYILDSYIWKFDGSNPGLREYLLGAAPTAASDKKLEQAAPDVKVAPDRQEMAAPGDGMKVMPNGSACDASPSPRAAP